MRYLIEVEQRTLYPVEVEAADRQEAEANVARNLWEPCGDPQPLPFRIRSIRELEA